MKTRFPVHPAALVPILLAVALLELSCGGGATLQPPPPASYKLSWNDEFNGTDGSSPDASKWTYDTGVGGNGWGNNELETYTNRTKNAQIQGGNLVITAVKETYADPPMASREITPQLASKLRAFSAKPMAASKPASRLARAGNVARFLDAWQ